MKNKTQSLLISIVTASFLAAPFSIAVENGITLVKDGTPNCMVELGLDPTPTEKHASEELRAYIKKVSGAEVAETQLGKKIEFKGCMIHLGTPESCPMIQAFGLSDKVKALSNEGFIIKTDKSSLFIVARKPIGVLYGVYTFLEDQLGIRWFYPGELGEYYPKKSTIEIGQIDNTQNPVFIVRYIHYVCAGMNAGGLDTWDWCVRNKMQVIETPWKKYQKELEERGAIRLVVAGSMLSDGLFKDHPEYYCLFNGKRHPCSGDGAYNICTSNPDVIELVAKSIIEQCKHQQSSDELYDKPADFIRLCNVDMGRWCECEKCRAQDDPVEQKSGGDGMVSTRFYKFANALVEKVTKEFPDKVIFCEANQGMREPPRGVKPDPRINIMVDMYGSCCQHAYDNTNCPANTDKMNVLKGWHKFGNGVGVYEFFDFIDGGFPYLPRENLVSLGIKYLAELGGKVWLTELPPPEGIFGYSHLGPGDHWRTTEIWYAQYATYYLAAKMLWNPAQDIRKLTEDMYQKYYGAAAGPMKNYRERMREFWETAAGHFIYGYHLSEVGKFLDQPGREQELLNYLAEAEKTAGADQALQQKIAREKKYFAETWQSALPQWRKLKEAKAVNVKKREGVIVVNGVLDEAAWKGAETVTGFNTKPNQPAKNQTLVKLLYDDDNIYIGVEAMEPAPDTLTAKFTERDSSVWKDDDIEVFIDPTGAGTPYYHFAINPKGGIYDAKCGSMGAYNSSWNGDCEVACKILPDRWVLEMKLKVTSLGAKTGKEAKWRMNVSRTRRAEGGEDSTWAADAGGIHEPSDFRPVVFTGGTTP